MKPAWRPGDGARTFDDPPTDAPPTEPVPMDPPEPMSSAVSLTSAWADALAAAPIDCSLILESNRRGIIAAAMYRRLTDDGAVDVFYATGPTETDALLALAAKVRGQAVAA